MTKQLLLSGLALATLALNACSSEPSDWRPDKKVSLDMIAPGTRSSQVFDVKESETQMEAHGAAIPRPINSEVVLDEQGKPNAEETISANDEKIRQQQGKAAQKKAAERSRTVQDDDSHK